MPRIWGVLTKRNVPSSPVKAFFFGELRRMMVPEAEATSAPCGKFMKLWGLAHHWCLDPSVGSHSERCQPKHRQPRSAGGRVGGFVEHTPITVRCVHLWLLLFTRLPSRKIFFPSIRVFSNESVLCVECKKAQPKEVMFPPGTRGRARGLPYTMDAFMLGMGMLGYPNFVATYGRGYPGFAPSYGYQFPGHPVSRGLPFVFCK
ncbi:hypothetical protein FD755_021197 [Muntiacus reevesi]|uniref:Uncharacterized protein n=1 Tax=Muntiacus reevesi TaxID=9886 RepID=A0A5N3X2L3_MUNRE|nr:hypothetical protein FD755_021197 [Muntiacus reevesi]